MHNSSHNRHVTTASVYSKPAGRKVQLCLHSARMGFEKISLKKLAKKKNTLNLCRRKLCALPYSDCVGLAYDNHKYLLPNYWRIRMDSSNINAL